MALNEIVTSLLLALAFAGSVYTLLTVVAARRVAGGPACEPQAFDSLTILRPLHGAEPGLYANLASFLDQDYPGEVRLVCGVSRADDGAVGVVEALRAAYPGRDIRLVVDGQYHGRNRKVSNLINMDRGEDGKIVLLADSDIRVGPGYLRTVIGALEAPGVGAVSCLYRGLAGPGIWARLSALGIDAHFLPNAALGIAFGLARPCFGSTIALRRETLRRAGGFEALRNHLADDYELGAAVRRLGLTVAFPPVVVDHACHDSSFARLIGHDLRWARTIRVINPAGHLGSLVTHPLPFALLAIASSGFSPLTIAVAAIVLAARFIAFAQLGVTCRLNPGASWRMSPALLLPIRDVLSYSVLIWSFFGRKVQWQGHHFDVAPDGSMTEPDADAAAEAARAIPRM